MTSSSHTLSMSNANTIEAKIARAGFRLVENATSTIWSNGKAQITVLCNPPMDGKRECLSVHVQRATEKSDSRSDYFPGAWFKSASKALAHAAGY